MKASELIAKLQAIQDKHGDIEVSVHCDQEEHPDGSPTDKVICTILWHDHANNPKELMICDRFTHGELHAQPVDDVDYSNGHGD